MAITNYLVHFKTEDTYNDKKSELRNDAVAFVKDATIIHTHGTDYYCGSGPVALKSDLSGYATTSALTSGLAGKANTSHTHTIAQVSGLQAELDSKLESADLSGYALKTDIPSLSGGASATSGQYVSGVTVSGHKITVTKATLPVTTLSSLGITATAAELNYMDGVTSSVQTQLNGKAASSHTHTASQVSGLATVATSGSYDDLTDKPSIPAAITVDSALSSTSTNPVQNKVINSALAGKAASTHTHSASQVSGLADVATSGSYNDLSNKPAIPSLSGYATQSWVQSQGYLTSVPAQSWASITGKPSTFTPADHTHSADDITSGTLAIARIPTGNSSVTVALGNHTHSAATTSTAGLMSAADKEKLDNISEDATAVAITQQVTSGAVSAIIAIRDVSGSINRTNIYYTDTRNTTGTSNSTSKLYLAGGTSQSSTGVQTYSNSAVYTQSGQLYATQMNATNGFYETSDATLKNFKDDIKALDVVSNIPTKYFTWKKDEIAKNMDPELHIGTSAQEIQKFYPDLVTADEDGILSVDYARLSIIALAAIKELKAEVDKLKQQNTKFKV